MSENIQQQDKNDVARIELTPEIVKKYICPLATDQEIYLFLQLCRFQKLNPFLREIYLIKYSATQPASMVTGKETFTKRASRHPQYKGFKAGVVVQNKQGYQYRQGGSIDFGEAFEPVLQSLEMNHCANR